MKDHFIRLFNYDQYANKLLTQLILTSAQQEKAVELMAHLFTAQQIWLDRCKALPPLRIPLWPKDWQPENFASIIDSNHKGWTDFLQTLTDNDFDKVISYESSVGNFQNTLSDILAHVINHGTHHRAQVGQLFKAAGVQLPPTDYIIYARELTYNNNPQ